MHVNTLQHTAAHCNTLQHTATHCKALQHTAAHCNTLQSTATHCNTLQHTATHCNKNRSNVSRIHVSLYTRTVQIYAYIEYVCLYSCDIHVCIYVYMYIDIHIYIYMRIQKHTSYASWPPCCSLVGLLYRSLLMYTRLFRPNNRSIFTFSRSKETSVHPIMIGQRRRVYIWYHWALLPVIIGLLCRHRPTQSRHTLQVNNPSKEPYNSSKEICMRDLMRVQVSRTGLEYVKRAIDMSNET